MSVGAAGPAGNETLRSAKSVRDRVETPDILDGLVRMCHCALYERTHIRRNARPAELNRPGCRWYLLYPVDTVLQLNTGVQTFDAQGPRPLTWKPSGCNAMVSPSGAALRVPRPHYPGTVRHEARAGQVPRRQGQRQRQVVARPVAALVCVVGVRTVAQARH